MKYDLNLLCKEQFKQEGQKKKKKEKGEVVNSCSSKDSPFSYFCFI
jgi:hypothetical protein